MWHCKSVTAIGLPALPSTHARFNHRGFRVCTYARSKQQAIDKSQKDELILVDESSAKKLPRKKQKKLLSVYESNKEEGDNNSALANSIEISNEDLEKKKQEKSTAVKSKRRSKALESIQETEKTQAEQLLGPFRQQHYVRIPVGDRHIVLESGSIGQQAGGAVTISDGETILYTTVCTAPEASEPSDFVPMYVHYYERFSAAGRTSGGFNKREGKPRDSEIFISRLIDRPLRPMIPKGYFHEIQILCWVLSYDGSHLPEPLAITAAGAALALSDIPLMKPVAGVRVGYINGDYVINPTAKEMSISRLDMVVGGNIDGLLMIEGYCDFLTDDELLKAVEVGQHTVSMICKELEVFGSQYGESKRFDRVRVYSPELEEAMEKLVGDKLLQALYIKSKKSRTTEISNLEMEVWSKLTKEGITSFGRTQQPADAIIWDDDEVEIKEDEVDQGDVHITPSSNTFSPKLYHPADVKLAFKQYTAKLLRTIIAKEKIRSDGRGISDVRPINSSCGLLPRAHGSAIFTRGETQALVAVILGGESMGQRIDGIMEPDEVKRFYVQYVFPHSCVGEVGRIGPASRREIGHGMLVERALEPIFPTDFPYTVRVESTITDSNGSSSMASVCGAYLALSDAGVPVKCPVAGVAMGLILDPKQYGARGGPIILTDILGSEDAFGDMDLKVAGSSTGITAFQMDLKVQGIGLSILKRALSKAKTARNHILKEMTKCSPPPSSKISKHVGHMDLVKVKREKVNMVIGTGGKTVRQIIDDTGVESVDVSSDGSIRILGKDREKVDKAKEKIRNITTDPVVGAVYR